MLQELRCPSCGAPLVDAARPCRFCGAVVVSAHAGEMAVSIEHVGEPLIEVIKCVREFSGLGLAEVRRALGRPPATFSITDRRIAPAQVAATLAALGCVGRLVTEPARLPLDPEFADHKGTWGFRIEVAGDAPLEAIKLIREIADMGLAEAKVALETPKMLIPIATGASHADIQRRFAAIGYAVSFAPSGG